MESIFYTSASKLLNLMNYGELSPLEVMKSTLSRIEDLDKKVNAFTNLYPEQALECAAAATEAAASKKPSGPLAGLPIGVKDLEDSAGMVTSFGSVPFQNNVARHDSTQVSRLKAAGAIVIGKTNTPEFGFTGFTKNRLFGTTRNPWNPDRTPGGSSGGSAAAVAGGMVWMATGSDGGGSVRIPASYTGCFGLKTSAGRIPWGPVPLLYMDNVSVMGPLTRTVEDAALYLDCVCGYHPSDPRSLPAPNLSYRECLKQPLKKLNIAFSPTLGYAAVQTDVADQVAEAVKCFTEMGHSVDLLDNDFFDPSDGWSVFMNMDIYAQIRDALASQRDKLGRSLVGSIETLGALTMDDLIQANVVRTEFNRVMWKLFDRYDLLLTPTMPTEAYAAEGPPPMEIEGKPTDILGAVAFTYPFNLSGHPAASVPAGLSDSKMPVGLQIVGPRHRDDLVLRAAAAFENVRPWNSTWPRL
ncbi:MAG: amidase [Desulfobacterales bacterium]